MIKGSDDRTTNRQQYRANHDRIFKRKIKLTVDDSRFKAGMAYAKAKHDRTFAKKHCPTCGKINTDDWPLKVGEDIKEGGCQECWEAQCNESWAIQAHAVNMCNPDTCDPMLTSARCKQCMEDANG